MNLLRTPEDRFQNLPNFDLNPHYVEIDGIRVHYLDEGKKGKETVLLLHGEPSWAFLYRHMIPVLSNSGFRVLVPDLIGFGRSDKPATRADHSYRKHVEWMTKWVKSVNISKITLFCQDWGSLIGLRVAIENQDLFCRIMLSNGGLPTGAQQMSEAFLKWQNFSKNAPKFDISSIIQEGTVSKLSKDILKGYDAPFPDDSYKEGPRIMPSLVPTSREDPEFEANTMAFKQFHEWNNPFMTAFSDSDPITRGGDRVWQKIVPGAKNQPHTIVKNAGHFIQEDKGPELAVLLIKFIEDNPI
jgi:haloalkane dehalogenase